MSTGFGVWFFSDNQISKDELLGARTRGENQIGDKVQNGTSGSVLFVDSSSNLQQDNTNFYWDDTNNRFGISAGVVNTVFEVGGTASISGTASVSGNFNAGVGTNASTAFVFSNSSATTGGCIVIKDNDGSGFTFLRVSNGTGTFSTVDCR